MMKKAMKKVAVAALVIGTLSMGTGAALANPNNGPGPDKGFNPQGEPQKMEQPSYQPQGDRHEAPRGGGTVHQPQMVKRPDDFHRKGIPPKRREPRPQPGGRFRGRQPGRGGGWGPKMRAWRW